jgi:hypothetical protein
MADPYDKILAVYNKALATNRSTYQRLGRNLEALRHCEPSPSRTVIEAWNLELQRQAEEASMEVRQAIEAARYDATPISPKEGPENQDHVNLKVTKCGECPHHKVGPSYSMDGFDRGNDWTCQLAKQEIVPFVERPSEEPRGLPVWCPLRSPFPRV